MKLSKQHIKDVVNIMGVPKNLAKDLIPLLPKVSILDKPLSPLMEKIYNLAFKILNLKKGMRILDLACGLGSISIPLAVKYQAYVDGYDILPGFIEYATKKAKKKGVAHLCKFKVGDVRRVVKQAKNYDVILWFSPPHLWKTAKETIKHLRNCCKDGGYIVIDEAYLYLDAPDKKDYQTYETLEKMTRGLSCFGDIVLKVFDYQGKDWQCDYEGDRKKIKEAINKIKNSRDKNILEEYLKSLDKLEKKDTANLGGAVWIIKINNKNISNQILVSHQLQKF